MLMILLLSILSAGSPVKPVAASPAFPPVTLPGQAPADPLAGTKWSAPVAKECIDSLAFRSGHRVRQYSCEADEWYNGTYVVVRDTVTVDWVSVSEDGGGKERWRTRYLYDGKVLRPVIRQSYSHGRWEKPLAVGTPVGYVFRRL
jgi:hypothetical protein